MYKYRHIVILLTVLSLSIILVSGCGEEPDYYGEVVNVLEDRPTIIVQTQRGPIGFGVGNTNGIEVGDYVHLFCGEGWIAQMHPAIFITEDPVRVKVIK